MRCARSLATTSDEGAEGSSEVISPSTTDAVNSFLSGSDSSGWSPAPAEGYRAAGARVAALIGAQHYGDASQQYSAFSMGPGWLHSSSAASTAIPHDEVFDSQHQVIL